MTGATSRRSPMRNSSSIIMGSARTLPSPSSARSASAQRAAYGSTTPTESSPPADIDAAAESAVGAVQNTARTIGSPVSADSAAARVMIGSSARSRARRYFAHSPTRSYSSGDPRARSAASRTESGSTLNCTLGIAIDACIHRTYSSAYSTGSLTSSAFSYLLPPIMSGSTNACPSMPNVSAPVTTDCSPLSLPHLLLLSYSRTNSRGCRPKPKPYAQRASASSNSAAIAQ
mmetsp:Transcript_13869/g.37195  ORF Transcript_13869/g.37195 Transcript_13869/m.37195 type:complete len:231 (-) Transcript_13869:415-1107(-)